MRKCFRVKKDLSSTSTQADPRLRRREGDREGHGLIHHHERRGKIKAHMLTLLEGLQGTGLIGGYNRREGCEPKHKGGRKANGQIHSKSRSTFYIYIYISPGLIFYHVNINNWYNY